MSPAINLSSHRDDRRTLVVVFLRGAADGLTLVAPIADDNYHKFRPRLAVKPNDAVRLDDIFGLHPNLNAGKEGAGPSGKKIGESLPTILFRKVLLH